MFNRLTHKLKTILNTKAAILMYHQVDQAECDPWQLVVDPNLFEAQLLALKKHFDIVSVDELTDSINRISPRKKRVAITFDDGCADNYRNAFPVLKTYRIPATFYVSTGYVNTSHTFWWEALQDIFLLKDHLPNTLEIEVAGKTLAYHFVKDQSLRSETKHQIKRWTAESESINERTDIFMRMWKLLQPLPFLQQNTVIKQLYEWVNAYSRPKIGCRVISIEQLKEMAEEPLITIGAHTVHHCMLSKHTPLVQQEEIKNSKARLEEWLHKKITAFAYPYGNFDHITSSIVKESGFQHAVSTVDSAVSSDSDLYALPRIQVKNIRSADLIQQLNHMLR